MTALPGRHSSPRTDRDLLQALSRLTGEWITRSQPDPGDRPGGEKVDLNDLDGRPIEPLPCSRQPLSSDFGGLRWTSFGPSVGLEWSPRTAMDTARTLAAAAPCLLLLGFALPGHGQQTVSLTAFTSGAFRWRDVSGNLYAESYRHSYSYTQATVSITYQTNGATLTGRMTAGNLKPHFAYQLKLSGLPDAHPAANEALGLSGRWWKEEWDGRRWADGSNLNDKGDGSSPNPNDLWYLAHRDDADATSPTGKRYRFTGYRPFDYFVTDGRGGATVDFAVTSAYHVVFKTSQRRPAAGDGPTLAHTLDPDPATQPAYDSDALPSAAGVFGEWERLPAGRIALAPGRYTVEFLVTEESFHEHAPHSGHWAHALHGLAHFTIVRPGTRTGAEPTAGGARAGEMIPFVIPMTPNPASAVTGRNRGVDGERADECSLSWTTDTQGRGTFFAAGAGAMVLVSHAATGSAVSANGLTLRAPACAALTVTALDAQPYLTSKAVLVTACGRCEKQGMGFSPDRRTVGRAWGTPPVRIEPVAGDVVLPGSWTCRALNPDGTRGEQVGLQRDDGRIRLALSPPYRTMWYLLEPGRQAFPE